MEKCPGPQIKIFPFVIRDESAPHILDCIFQSLDQNALAKCRLVSTVWKGFIDYPTSLWDRVSKTKYKKYMHWEAGKDKNPANQLGWTLLHFAAGEGHLEVCRLIMDNVQDKNPADHHDWTPLHETAKRGRFEVCRLIIEKVPDKNPESKTGVTPLHVAAREGHLQVCRLIMDNVQDKNSADHQGWTPLHEAAKRGHHAVCSLIIANVQDKNPTTIFGATPLSLAKSFKHCKTVKLFQNTPCAEKTGYLKTTFALRYQ